MSTISDFTASYDYNGFFSELSRQIEDIGLENTYQTISNRHIIEFYLIENEVVVVASIFDHPYNGIHIAIDFQMPCDDADSKCNQLNLLAKHVVFTHMEERFHGLVQIPVPLGEGWDELIREEVILAIKEIQKILDSPISSWI